MNQDKAVQNCIGVTLYSSRERTKFATYLSLCSHMLCLDPKTLLYFSKKLPHQRKKSNVYSTDEGTEVIYGS